MDPLRTVIKTLRRCVGKLCPPHSPRFLFTPCRPEHRAINKKCFTRIIFVDLFKSHRAGSLFANGRATSPPTHPRAFQLSKEHVKYHPASKNRTHMEPLRTRDKDIVFASREGLCPPNPTLSFYAVQACFQKHRTINKNCFKRIVVIDFVKSIMQAVFL